MVLTFEPNDFVVDAARFTLRVGVTALTGGAPEIPTSAFDEGFTRRL